MTWQEFIKSRFTTWILGAVLFLVMVVTAKILIQKHVVDKEIAKLQAQVEKIKIDNNQLTYLVQYLNTPEYQDKAAREKLNLKKDGEFVVGLPNNDQTSSDTPLNIQKPTNFVKWFNYFFSKPVN